jgi:hypothetical protein
MRDKLVLWFLGFLETMKYSLEQSHGVPPVSVALDHTTLKEVGSCGYSSVKTVRSIVIEEQLYWRKTLSTTDRACFLHFEGSCKDTSY